MSVLDPNDDPSGGGGPTASGNWWEGPPPPGYTGPWPPPLQPGQTYGQAFGSIDSTGMTPSDPNFGGYGPTPGSTQGSYGGPLPGAVAPPAATTPPATGGGGDSSTVTPPSLGTFTPPPMLDQGGQPGLSYIPPTPQFTAPQFKPPSVEEALNDPGYKFRLQQGDAGLQNWAAARGTLNSSDTANALEDYNQNAASQEYGNVWNRDFSAFTGSTLPSWLAGTVNPAMTAYNTQASAGEFQNNSNYLNAWNSFLNAQGNAKWFATQ